MISRAQCLLVATLLFGALTGAGEARAQEGAWCAYAGGRDDYENCGYYTLEQCVVSVRGVGGACRPNPRGGYAPPGYGPPHGYDEPPPQRRPRRYY